MPFPQQLFRLSQQIIGAISEEELFATFLDMEELGIAQPPYPDYSIEVPYNSVVTVAMRDGSRIKLQESADWRIIFNISTRGDGQRECLLNIPETKTVKHIPDFAQWLIDEERKHGASKAECDSLGNTISNIGKYLEQLLIVLLATKNIVKETKRNSLAKFGLGKNRAEYTTTLKIGKVTEKSSEDKKDGPISSRRPHLRRGHIRRQHYGPNNELVKQVFIQPVFVNADQEFIGSRTAYNVSMGTGVRP